MNTPEANDPIEKMLREQDVYVADNGFARKVIARLPRRRSQLPRIISLIVVIIGAVFAVCCLPWKNLPPLDFSTMFSSGSDVLTAWLPMGAVIVALASLAVAALRREC